MMQWLIRLQFTVYVSNPGGKVEGTVKMMRDPTGRKFNSKNVVYRGNCLVRATWAIGVVLHAGHETKQWNGYEKRKKQKGQLDCTLEKLVCFSIVLIGGLTIVSSLFTLSRESSDFVYDLLVFFELYKNTIPVSVFIYLEFAKQILGLLASDKFENTDIYNVDIFDSLSQAEYVLSNKTGTLTVNEAKVQACIIKDTVHWNKPYSNVLDTEIREEELYSKNEETAVFQDISDRIFNQEDYKEYTHFVLSIALCNMVTSNSHTSQDDKILFESVKYFNVNIIKKTAKSAVIEHEGDLYTFKIIGYQQFNPNKSMTIVESHELGVFLYVKGSEEEMLKLLGLEESKEGKIKGILDQQNLLSMKNIFLAYKKLSVDDADLFHLEYKAASLSPINTKVRMESVFEKYLRNLKILGIACVQEEVPTQTSESLSNIKELGLKVWVVTGSCEQSALAAGVSCGLITSTCTLHILKHIDSSVDAVEVVGDAIEKLIYHRKLRNNASLDSEESEENITSRKMPTNHFRPLETLRHRKDHRKYSLKSKVSLHPLYKSPIGTERALSLKEHVNPEQLDYVLAIQGESFEYMLSAACKQLLIILLFSAKSIIFYGLVPSQKEEVARLLQGNFSFKPVVIGVGSSESDLRMVDWCSVGVCVNKNEMEESFLSGVSDVRVESLAVLDGLIAKSRVLYTNLLKTLWVLFHMYFLISIVEFSYDFFTGHSGTKVFSIETTAIFEYFVVFFPVLGICLFSTDSNAHIMNRKGLILLYVSGLSQGMVVSLGNTYALFSILNDEGKTGNTDINEMLFFVEFSILFNLQVLLTYTKIPPLSLFFSCLSLGVSIGFILISASTEESSLYGIMNPLLSSSILLRILLVVGTCIIVYISLYYAILYPPPINRHRIQQFAGKISTVFSSCKLNDRKVGKDSVSLNLKSLTFQDPSKESEFRSLRLSEEFSLYIVSYLSLFMIYLLSQLPYLIQGPALDSSFLIVLFILSAHILLICYSFTASFKRTYTTLTLYSYIFILSSLLISPALSDQFYPALFPVYVSIYFISIRSNWLELLIFSVFYTFALSLAVLLSTPSDSGLILALLTVNYTAISLCLVFLFSLTSYKTDKSQRKGFSIIQIYHREVKKSKTALGYLLPEFVRKRVNAGERALAEDQGTVSILFCNICHFDRILRNYPPHELVAFLDDVFCKFDELCYDIGVTKIETVRNTYVACTGLKDSDSQLEGPLREIPHTRRTIEMGFSLLRTASQIILKDGSPLSVRIGIHTGPVTAGVLGHHKPQFSLVGDTVNTASRMASTCKERNRIHISSETFACLTDVDGLGFESMETEVKGKGRMLTYYVWLDSSMGGNIKMGTAKGSQYSMKRNFKLSEGPRKETIYELVGVGGEAELFRGSISGIDEAKWLTVHCRESECERKFRLKNIRKNKHVFLGGIVCQLIVLVLEGISISIEIGLIDSTSYSIFELVFDTVLIVGGVAIWTLYKIKWENLWFACFLQIFYTFCLLKVLLSVYYSEKAEYHELYNLKILFQLTLLVHHSILFLKHSLWAGLPSIIGTLVFLLSFFRISDLHHYFLLFFFLVLVFNHYNIEKRLRVYFTLKSMADKELLKTEALNSQMMPPPVFERFKEGKIINDNFSQVTMIYADIVGFTSWSSTKKPKEIIRMLTRLFKKFDKKSQQHEVYKVHTVGDCYVAMGYTGTKERNSAQEAYNTLKFAFSLTEVINSINTSEEIELSMRIGIHTGDVICGLPGTNIVRYDIYGLDAVIANECESHGDPGSVVVSGATRSLLEAFYPSSFSFEFYRTFTSKYAHRDISLYIVSSPDITVYDIL